jgi:iron complex transport system substrate-binding protein
VLGCEPPAREIVQDIRDELKQIREYSAVWPDHPRVYFEEWPEPLITGIRWVSELIEIAGGRDIFAELRGEGRASGRIVPPEEVVRRDPEIILASWCGKPVERATIASRPHWQSISAVKQGQIHELSGNDILAPGPSLMVGLRRIHEIVQAFQASG